MSEAKNKRTQKETVELSSGFATVTTLVEYTKQKAAEPILSRVDNFMTYLGEYPNAQLDLFKNELKMKPAGDSRTDPDKKELKESRPKTGKKSASKKTTAPKKKPSTKKSGRDRAAV